jgi:hypothetical protein
MAFAPLNEHSFTEEQIAVAVTKGGFNAGHIGIGFRAKGGQPKVLHLAWHHKFRVDFIPEDIEGDCWIAQILPVPPSTGKQLAAYMRAASMNKFEIPYGLDVHAAKGSFDQNAKYQPSSDSDGLTCATFVTEMLRGACVDLIQEDFWEKTEANVAWGKAVAKILSNEGANPLHVAAVEKSAEKGIRVRPYEVAGAASLSREAWPVSFADSQQPAYEVEAALADCCEDVKT